METVKALVSGVAGFIGSHVAEHCLKAGMEVYGFDNFASGYEENIPEGVVWKPLQLGNLHGMGGFFKDNAPFDYIYHCAAYAAEVKSHEHRSFVYHNNIIGSANLIQAVMDTGCKRFVFVSSAAVYGESKDVPSPCDPYGISKLATEQDLKVSGLPYTIFRAHNVYGPRQNMNDPDRNVVAIFMKQYLSGHPMTVFGNGSQRRQFSYIDDVAPYIVQAPLISESENRIFNIGSDEDISIAELVPYIALGHACAEIKRLPERKEVKCVRVSHEAFKEVFKPKPCVPLVEGIARMADWATSRE